MKTGVELISDERGEHFSKHRRTIEKDVIENSNKELVSGAIALIDPLLDDGGSSHEMMKRFGGFSDKWDEAIIINMINKSYKERLIIAGSFIAAEIDRLQAIETKEQ